MNNFLLFKFWCKKTKNWCNKNKNVALKKSFWGNNAKIIVQKMLRIWNCESRVPDGPSGI